MLRKFPLQLILFIVLSGTVTAQSTEFGLFLGTTTYKGELNNSLFNTRLIQPAVGLLYRKNFNNHWAYRVGFNFGSISGDDALANDSYQNNRNLSFRSRLWDAHLLAEFNFFPYQLANPKTRFSPFIFAGISVYHFNPQAENGGEWYDLQPLGTEGQGTSAYPDRNKYKRLAVGIPFGGGFKIKFTRRFGMTIEAGARRIYTDYLDDVSTTYAEKNVLLAQNGELAVLFSDRSIDGQALLNDNRQRGNASDKDWFMFTGITINYTLSSKYGDNCTPFRGKLR
ncbi:MAG: outer membrane beta-barrel protein [Bacteroidetes bacterium]|nr:outer membrane beta-barrel protein [Bacteroidota bacterium]